MGDIIRIHCPSAEYGKEERIRILFEDIRRWVRSSALKELVALYGGAPMEGLSLGEYIRWLNEFVHLWCWTAN